MARSRKRDDETRPVQRQSGPTSRIREVVSHFVEDWTSDEPIEAARSVRRKLKKREAKRIVEGALERHFQKQELMPYQAELIKLLQHSESTGRKVIILFDGRDASGKGGTIRRVVRYLNEKQYRSKPPTDGIGVTEPKLSERTRCVRHRPGCCSAPPRRRR